MLPPDKVILRADRLSKSFRGHVAVEDISFTVRAGESLGLLGESGAGKSTLARLLMCIRKPDSGQLWFGDTELTALSERQLRPLRSQFQFVFQDPDAALNPKQTIRTSLSRGYQATQAESADVEMEGLLSKLGLKLDVLDRYPRELSGGQKQRVVIARAIATNPSLLIADEPTAALDASVQIQVLNLLRQLQKEALTIICISHDIRVVSYLCSHIGVLRHGRLIELGDAEKVLTEPKHPYTRELLIASR